MYFFISLIWPEKFHIQFFFCVFRLVIGNWNEWKETIILAEMNWTLNGKRTQKVHPNNNNKKINGWGPKSRAFISILAYKVNGNIYLLRWKFLLEPRKKKKILFENSNQLDCILYDVPQQQQQKYLYWKSLNWFDVCQGNDWIFSSVHCFNGSATVNNNVCSVSFKIDFWLYEILW